MQLMWVSGPTGRIHTFSITGKKLMAGFGMLVIFSIIVGMVLHFVGLQIAIQVSPSVVQSLGGVTTAEEQKRTEAGYRLQLQSLEEKLQQAEERLDKLQSLKERFAKLATPSGFPAENSAYKSKGTGGPLREWIPKSFVSIHTTPVSQDIEQVTIVADDLQNLSKKIHESWETQLSRLESLPTNTPVSGNFNFSSGFGARVDPITGSIARHEGLDLTAPVGTPIVAAGHGKVIFAGWDHQYGWMIDIDHQNGLVSRYAHASELLVKAGEKISRGQLIARVGSTGRSTGAHLHFEIHRNSVPENPARYVQRG